MYDTILYMAVIATIIYALHLCLPRITEWRLRKKKQDFIVEKYENLRNLRRELLYHIDWAKERGDRHEAVKLEPEIERIDG
jgi:hypothetical protein